MNELLMITFAVLLIGTAPAQNRQNVWSKLSPKDVTRLKEEHHDKGLNRRFLVTNMVGTPEALYDFYALRGDCENRIQELKNELKGDRLSCHRFVANQFRLLLHAAADVLLQALKKYLEGTVLANAQTCPRLDRGSARFAVNC